MKKLAVKLTIKLAVGLLTLSLCAALAVTYRVDSAGGPEGLAAAAKEAFAAWQALTEGLEITESEDATTVFRYGDIALLGDDTLSLTVQRQDGERSLTVLVTPTLGAQATNALLHETGLLLDLAASDSGVMNPALPETPLSLGDTETAALGSLSAVKEDVDRDGTVGFYDLVALAKSYGQPGINAPADINEDGLVDRQDLELLRAAYVFTPPSPTGPPQPDQTDGTPGDPSLGDPSPENGLAPLPGAADETPTAEDALPADPLPQNPGGEAPVDQNPPPPPDEETP